MITRFRAPHTIVSQTIVSWFVSIVMQFMFLVGSQIYSCRRAQYRFQSVSLVQSHYSCPYSNNFPSRPHDVESAASARRT